MFNAFIIHVHLFLRITHLYNENKKCSICSVTINTYLNIIHIILDPLNYYVQNIGENRGIFLNQ